MSYTLANTVIWDTVKCLKSVSPLTWNGHNGDSQKGGRARDHVEDGEAGVGSSSSGEEKAE